MVAALSTRESACHKIWSLWLFPALTTKHGVCPSVRQTPLEPPSSSPPSKALRTRRTGHTRETANAGFAGTGGDGARGLRGVGTPFPKERDDSDDRAAGLSGGKTRGVPRAGRKRGACCISDQTCPALCLHLRQTGEAGGGLHRPPLGIPIRPDRSKEKKPMVIAGLGRAWHHVASSEAQSPPCARARSQPEMGQRKLPGNQET